MQPIKFPRISASLPAKAVKPFKEADKEARQAVERIKKKIKDDEKGLSKDQIAKRAEE